MNVSDSKVIFCVESKTRRRICQLHLRTAMIALTVFSLVCGVTANWWHHKQRVTAAVAKLHNMGLGVEYRETVGITWPSFLFADESRGTVKRVFGRAKIDRRVELSDVLVSIRELGNSVEGIDIQFAFRGVRGLEAITQFPNLKSVKLPDCGVTDDDVKNLTGLSGMKELSLSNTSVSDTSVATLSRLSSLERLDVSFSLISQDGLRRLRHALPNTVIIY